MTDINLIPDLPQEPFENGVGAYEGVVMHATAVYNDTDEGERQYECGHFQEAFVHTFSDERHRLQVASYDYIAYGAGHTANAKYLHNELCQVHNDGSEHAAGLFHAGYVNWITVAAEQLAARKLGVIDNVTIRSHAQTSDEWHETDHQDPIGYLAEWGKTWANVVNDVLYLYNEMTKPAEIPPPVQFDGSRDVWHVKDGDTLVHIGMSVGVPWEILARFNHMADPNVLGPVDTLIHIPLIYKVKPGDTLSVIAAANGADWHEVARVNQHDPDRIFVGEVLYV